MRGCSRRMRNQYVAGNLREASKACSDHLQASLLSSYYLRKRVTYHRALILLLLMNKVPYVLSKCRSEIEFCVIRDDVRRRRDVADETM